MRERSIGKKNYFNPPRNRISGRCQYGSGMSRKKDVVSLKFQTILIGLKPWHLSTVRYPRTLSHIFPIDWIVHRSSALIAKLFYPEGDGKKLHRFVKTRKVHGVSFFFNDLTKLKLFHQLQLQFSRWSVQVEGRKGTVETRAYIKIKQDVARYNLPVFQRGFIVLFTRV